MWFADLVLLGGVYLFSLVWQLIAFPWLAIFFPLLIDGGWALGRVLTTLIVSLVIFSLASLGFPVNTTPFLVGLALFFLGVSAVFFYKQKKSLWKEIKTRRLVIVVEELLFLSGLIFMGTMRGFWPSLDNLEKFMDFGFINQYLLSPKLPIQDMWLAGQTVNYYSFGHFWASEIIRLLGVKPAVGFNLVLAIFFGWDLMLSFSIVCNLIGKTTMQWKKIMGGLVGAGLVCLGGNSHILWFMIKNHGLWEGDAPYWYALATRFIPQTIHEFPSYTFTMGDLHAHLIDLSIVLSFLLVVIAWEKRPVVKLEVLMGTLLGVMVMTNTWDFAVYSLFLFIFFISKGIGRVIIKAVLIIFGVAIMISAPWWWSFKPMSETLRWVSERSPLWQLAVLWSGQILFGLVAWTLAKKNILIRSLVVAAFVLIVIPEIIYLVDIYPTYPRANTMFKLTYQAFVLLSLAGGVAVGSSFNKKTWLVSALLIIVSAGLLVYPWTSYPNFYSNFKEYHGLDGEVGMAKEIPDKYGAIVYLKNHRDGKSLIEYPGASFSLSNATPVFSGVPTVLGWRNHEWLWRNNKELIDTRVEQIKTVYEAPEGSEAKRVVAQYKVGWILVGREERENYAVNNLDLKRIGEVVWESGENYLVKVK